MIGFGAWVNLLDYPAAVLPITLVDKNVDVVDQNFKPLSSLDEEIQLNCKFYFYLWYFPTWRLTCFR